MTTKTFLTSAVAMGFIAPVMAAPTNTGTFPSTGLMQADYTYTNAATSTNMDGVYEGTVNAEAQYENILYTIGAGKYLPAGSETVIDCNQSGYFCPGLQSQVQYDENNAQGLTSCSTATNGAYTLSDGTGTSADTCYATGTATCSKRNPYLYGHATNVAYGNSTNGSASCKTYYGDTSTCVLDNANACAITGLTCESGYTSTTFGEWMLANISLFAQYMGRATTCAINNSVENCNDYNLEPGEMKLVHDAPPIQGFSSTTYILACSDIPGDANNVNTMLSPKESMTQGQATGKYCWYRINKFNNIETKTSQWFFGNEEESTEDCASRCGYANFVQNTANYITAMAMSVTNERICAANAITINWTDADSEDITANNAGSTFYGGDIRTPVKAQTKPGKRFTGWRFSKPTQTNLP